MASTRALERERLAKNPPDRVPMPRCSIITHLAVAAIGALRPVVPPPCRLNVGARSKTTRRLHGKVRCKGGTMRAQRKRRCGKAKDFLNRLSNSAPGLVP